MGCVLNFTRNDFQQLSKSLHERIEGAHLDKSQRDQIRETLHNSSRNQLLSILEKPDSPAYKAVSQLLIGTMVSKMSVQEKNALPAAFHTILKHTPNAMGLFVKAPSHRGPGSSPVQHHYEILATAALIESRNYKSINGHYKSKSGKDLYIAPLDRVDFGMKFSRGYAEPRRFGTIEADMLVSRSTLNPFSEDFGKTVAIDAKYSQIGKYSNKPEQRQLDGIRTGLRDGKVHEFFFVTNREFGKNFKDAIEKENLLIAKDFVHRINREYKDVPQNLLTEQELKNIPTQKTPSVFFTVHTKEVADFVTKYKIPQIDICENVHYPGT